MDTPFVRHRQDYRAPDFHVTNTLLDFDIRASYTDVTCRLQLVPARTSVPCVLDGSAELLSAAVDGKLLETHEYRLENEKLIITAVPDTAFEATIKTRIFPADNKSLMGLYESSGNLYTQCEPEGFRKITYYPDRPDVMSVFTTTITADKTRFPVLLSNGNKTASAEGPDGRHTATWHDPFAKPSYLFALVAGDLAVLESRFVTRSGHDVRLQFYTRSEDRDRAGFALDSLRNAMRWDEERFGLEYDLDIYMVVAVGDFNMGAMENKGLNIFNTKYVLADTQTATDDDFAAVEGVIGHEYFHNWTGNRVTCRDWFQLSLKEGLTVFRDQEFSADRGGHAVNRIRNVRLLRSLQFAEDAGPTAHPVRPDSYEEINNFYTLTVYEKGAEVVRMYHTLLGEAGFQKGMHLYFERHDGQAVTCDDFLAAMGDANDRDLQQFSRWYAQAGTPVVEVTGHYDAAARTYTLHMRQHTPPTPGQAHKEPLLIPVCTALVGRSGNKLPFSLGAGVPPQSEAVLLLKNPEEDFVLHGVGEDAVPSLLRGFSAPVRLSFPYAPADLGLLLRDDDDAFVRWDALQQLYRQAALTNLAALKIGDIPPEHARLADTLASVLHEDTDPAFRALLLQLPEESELWEDDKDIDPVLYVQALSALQESLARALAPELNLLAEDMALRETAGGYADPAAYRPESAGIRSLLNAARRWLAAAVPATVDRYCSDNPAFVSNMTHEWGILCAANHAGLPARDRLLARFAERHGSDTLAMDKYFQLTGASKRQDTLQRVQAAMQHPAFLPENPNKLRALLGSFTRNTLRFHAEDGSGYAFIADRILEIDVFNPQVAARLVQAFNLYARLEGKRQALAGIELQRIRSAEHLSKDSREIVDKILAGSVAD